MNDLTISYCSPFSILVHNLSSLKRIYCPFRVKIRHQNNEEGKVCHEVIKVGLKEGITHYLIGGEWYEYSLFEII